ncbi:hypothetical protein FACS1894184_20400 [Clostridia bacterium]|nr:hypothetical protein FACS1894184_20400 [Clostridia bacterium]
MTSRTFNTEGVCVPSLHYMVDTSAKIGRIVREFIEPGKYFVINRARQFGKTTTLRLMDKTLSAKFTTLRISFEGREELFTTQTAFARGFCSLLARTMQSISPDIAEWLAEPFTSDLPFAELSLRISKLCGCIDRDVVLMIDEVDRASDYAIFMSFLGLLRQMYLDRSDAGDHSTFHSVILAGVHDIKNLKAKIRPDSEHTYNSPWNIAAQFDIDMSFSPYEIASMLNEYESDYQTGMDVAAVATRIYYYTDGYPFLVSLFCKRMYDNGYEWSAVGVDQAMRLILKEKNTLFDDIIKNLNNNKNFSRLIEKIVLTGVRVSFSADNETLDLGIMYGILKEENDRVQIANVVFMTRLTYYYVSLSEIAEIVEARSDSERNLFIKGEVLDMDAVLERFHAFMHESYRERDSAFIESNARLIFTAFLRPIINGKGFCAPEAEVRGARRIDLSVVYGWQRDIVELKVWRGEKYEEAGRVQLAGYCKSIGQSKGYLVSFCDLKRDKPVGGVYVYDGVTIKEVIVAFSDQV